MFPGTSAIAALGVSSCRRAAGFGTCSVACKGAITLGRTMTEYSRRQVLSRPEGFSPLLPLPLPTPLRLAMAEVKDCRQYSRRMVGERPGPMGVVSGVPPAVKQQRQKIDIVVKFC